MDIDIWDEEQDKNRKLDKYEINDSMDLDNIDDILCKEYEYFEYIILYAALSRQKVKKKLLLKKIFNNYYFDLFNNLYIFTLLHFSII